MIDGITSDFVYSTSDKPKVVGPDYDNSRMEHKDFLKVLLADLQWQNPLEARDISDFIDNTVKLREMEVLNSFESAVSKLLSSITSQSLIYAGTFIGKTVEYEGNMTYVKNGKGYASFELTDSADFVKVSILDSDGNVVEEKGFTSLKPGKRYSLEIENPSLKDGYYTIVVEAKKEDGTSVDAKVYSFALVERVRKENDSIVLETGSFSIPLEKVNAIGG